MTRMFFYKVLFKSFVQRKKRILLAVLAVVMGASLASALINIYLNVDEKVGKELRSFGPNIVVEPRSNELSLEVGGVTLNSGSGGRYIREDELFKLKKIFWKYNIVGFAPYLSLAVKAGAGEEKVALTGTWFEKEVPVPGEEFKSFTAGARIISPWWKVDGQWVLNPDDKSKAMIGSAVARSLKLKVGDSFQVIYGDKKHPLKVAAIVDAGGSDDKQIFVNLPVVQGLAGLENKVARVKVSAMIVPEDDFSRRDNKTMTPEEFERWYCTPYISAIVKQIEEVFPDADAEPIAQIAQAEGNMMQKIKLTVLFVTLIALAASALGVTTVMTANVLERRKEIGMIKAIGAENLQVALLFAGEAAAIGIAGGVTGYLIGLGLAKFIAATVFVTEMKPEVMVLPATVVIALAVALLGSILPVRRAIGTEPVVVLRGE